MSPLPGNWLTKVADAIGLSPKQTEEMIMKWYSQGKPLQEIEAVLIQLAQANGKTLIFAKTNLN